MNTVPAIVDTIALIAAPIIAVVVGQALRNRAAKRKDKMAIFPEGLIQRMENSAKFEKGQLAFAKFMTDMVGDPSQIGNAMLQQAAKQEDKNHADA